MISGSTRLYAIIGDPIGHVRTPNRFNERFAADKTDAVCVAMHVPAHAFNSCLLGLKAMPNLDGLVVTAPHKAAIMRFCDVVDTGARRAGAVNVVRRLPDGRYSGTLLDGTGFVSGLRSQGHEPAGQRVFMQGAGGAASAIGLALAEAGAAEIAIRNRSGERAGVLAKRIAEAFPGCRTRVVEQPGSETIAINATPLGLAAADDLPFDPAALKPGTIVAEVLMKPPVTRLLEVALARGLAIHEGAHMLDQQIALMFRFFGLETPNLAGGAST